MKLKEDEGKELQKFRLIADEKLVNTFQNVFIVLRIYLFNGDEMFRGTLLSALKRVKNALRPLRKNNVRMH